MSHFKTLLSFNSPKTLFKSKGTELIVKMIRILKNQRILPNVINKTQGINKQQQIVSKIVSKIDLSSISI